MLLGQVDMSVLPSQGDPLCGLTQVCPGADRADVTSRFTDQEPGG